MTEFYLTLVSTLTAFVLCYKIIPVIIEVAREKKLFDLPDHRKQHTTPVPPLGGVAILISLAFAFFLFADLGQSPELKLGFIGVLIIFFMGLKDDLLEMDATQKFLIQIAMAALAAHGGIRITHLHNILGLESLSLPAQYIISIFAIVGLANAFNLIDGIDGLAGGLSSICFLGLGLIFSSLGLYTYSLLAFTGLGATLAFLKYNFSPAKIFMGDAGSLSLGFIIAIMCIKLVQSTAVLSGFVSINSLFVSFVFSLIIIPVADVSQVMINRILHGRSPFDPDRGHIHHILLRLGLSHKQAAIVLWGNSLFFFSVCLGAFFLSFSPGLALGGILIYAYTAVMVLHWKDRMKKANAQTLRNKEKQFAHAGFSLQKQV
ncbi:MAG: MraY family glycosyltransferase [Bacteroidota bacterium]